MSAWARRSNGGAYIEYYKGVEGFFKRINEFGAESKLVHITPLYYCTL